MKCIGCDDNHKKSEMKICHGCKIFYCSQCQNNHSPCYASSSEVYLPHGSKVHSMKRRKKNEPDPIVEKDDDDTT